MSKYCSDSRQRHSKRYLEIHDQLRRETALGKVAREMAANREALCGISDLMRGEPTKQDRKRQNSREFRATGDR